MESKPWANTTLGYLGSFRNGVNFSREQEGSGLPVLKVKDFGNETYVPIEGLDELDPTVFALRDSMTLAPGDTVIIRSNGNPEMVGRSLYHRGSSRTVTFSGFCIRFRPEQDHVDPRFAAYFIKSPECRQRFTAHGSGTTIHNLNQAILSEMPLMLPPIDEQRRIAAVLGTLDDKIELNRSMSRTLEDLAKAVFKSWFLDFDGHHPQDMLESQLGPIPRGWKVASLDSIADFLNGAACQKYPAVEGQPSLPVIKIRELSQGITAGTDQATAEIPAKWWVADGDVLFSWSGSLVVKVWTGGPGALNQHLFKVTSSLYPRWYFLLWIKHHLAEFQVIASDKATTMGHIQRHHLSNAKVLVPTRDALTKVGELLGPLVDRLVANDLESRTLAVLRDALLPKLISGEIRVPEAEQAVEVAA